MSFIINIIHIKQFKLLDLAFIPAMLFIIKSCNLFVLSRDRHRANYSLEKQSSFIYRVSHN